MWATSFCIEVEIDSRDIRYSGIHAELLMILISNFQPQVQKKTTASMSTLEKLDNVKTKLVATSVALQEADKWTSLAKQIEQVMDPY